MSELVGFFELLDNFWLFMAILLVISVLSPQVVPGLLKHSPVFSIQGQDDSFAILDTLCGYS